MDSSTTPIYIIIGSILGIISALVLIILHLPEVVSVIRSFSDWLRKRLKEFNRWRWWRQYRPSWEIANYGELKITKVGDKYDLSMQVEIEYKNRNDKYRVNCSDGDIYVKLYHEGKGWEGQPYYLRNLLSVGVRLNPSKSERVTCLFHRDMSVKPLIKETAICKVVGYIVGIIREDTPFADLYGKFKRKGSNKFKVGVVWSNGVDTNEKVPSN